MNKPIVNIQQAQASDNLPFVSCICPTYGRPNILEEAIESFLRQDYSGPKELVILNDFTEQELIFEHPEVRIINSPARISPLGKKFNECIKLCRGDVLLVWDDDDIFLPWRISYSIRNLKDGLFHTSSGYYEPGISQKLTFSQNYYHSNMAITADRFHEAKGYDESRDTSSIDVELMMRLGLPGSTIAVDECFYIYRWAGTNSYHVSGWHNHPDGVTENTSRYLKDQLRQGKCMTGRIELSPHWSRDWLQLAREAVAENDTRHESVSTSCAISREMVLELTDTDMLDFNTEGAGVKDEDGNLISHVNGIGVLLLKMVNGRRTVGEMCDLLQSVFDDISEQDRREARLFLDECLQRGVLQISQDLLGRLRIGILTQITPEIEGYGRYSEAINRSYAQAMGYDHIVLRNMPFEDRAAPWGSIWMLKEYLDDYDYLFFMDADAIITRFDLPLHHFIRQQADKDLLICDDRPMGGPWANTGAYFLRRSKWSVEFVKQWWEMGLQSEYAWGFPTEQKALAALYAENCMDVVKHAHVFAPDTFNSFYPPIPTYTENHFILHLMNTPDDERERVFRDWHEKLVGEPLEQTCN